MLSPSQAFGQSAEDMAEQMLRKKGYRILERNFRVAGGELDLIADNPAGYRAFINIGSPPDYLLLDALHLPTVYVRQRSVIKGDQLSISIAAASILAKVSRDRIMHAYHEQYPDYQFHIHKGYPTPEHLKRLQQFGPCPGHRRSFRPVQACLVA